MPPLGSYCIGTRLQHHFIRALFSTRPKIDHAFGRYEGHWHVLVDNKIRDQVFICDVALMCAALHNVYERANCCLNKRWNVATADFAQIDQPCLLWVDWKISQLAMMFDMLFPNASD